MIVLCWAEAPKSCQAPVSAEPEERQVNCILRRHDSWAAKAITGDTPRQREVARRGWLVGVGRGFRMKHVDLNKVTSALPMRSALLTRRQDKRRDMSKPGNFINHMMPSS